MAISRENSGLSMRFQCQDSVAKSKREKKCLLREIVLKNIEVFNGRKKSKMRRGSCSGDRPKMWIQRSQGGESYVCLRVQVSHLTSRGQKEPGPGTRDQGSI